MSAAIATKIPEPAAVAKLLREIALIEVLPRFRQLKSHEIREKSPGDFVTVADEAMEAALAPKLAALLPGSLLVGEEDTARDPSIMRRLASDQPVWVIDPVDGTANFAEGKEEFCSMMALIERDQVLGGWILRSGDRHDQLCGEGRRRLERRKAPGACRNAEPVPRRRCGRFERRQGNRQTGSATP